MIEIRSETMDDQIFVYFKWDKKSYKYSEKEFYNEIDSFIAGDNDVFATISAEDFLKLLEFKTNLLKKKYKNIDESTWKRLVKHYIDIFVVSVEKKYLQEAYNLRLEPKNAEKEVEQSFKNLEELLKNKDNERLCILADFYFDIKKIDDCIRLYRIAYLDLLDNLDDDSTTVLETLVDLVYCQLISEEPCTLLDELVADFEKFLDVLDDNDNKIKSKAIFIRTKYYLDLKKELSIDDIIDGFAASELLKNETKEFRVLISNTKNQLLWNILSEKMFELFLIQLQEKQPAYVDMAEKLILLDCSLQKKKAMLRALASYYEKSRNYLKTLELLLQVYALKNTIISSKQDIEAQISIIKVCSLKPKLFSILDEGNLKLLIECIEDAVDSDMEIKAKAKQLLIEIKKVEIKEKLFDEKNRANFHQSNESKGKGMEQELQEFLPEEYENRIHQ